MTDITFQTSNNIEIHEQNANNKQIRKHTTTTTTTSIVGNITTIVTYVVDVETIISLPQLNVVSTTPINVISSQSAAARLFTESDYEDSDDKSEHNLDELPRVA